MRIKIIINKWANFYFFIENLSQWNELWCKKTFNEDWIKHIGWLNESQSEKLKVFASIRKKFPLQKSIFEKSFFFSKNPFKNLKQHLSENELNNIKKVFDEFSWIFDDIFIKDLILLNKWKKELNKKLPKIQNKDLWIEISRFYWIKPKNKIVDLFLLLSVWNTFWWWANVNNTSITLNISQLSINKIMNIICVGLHELIHLFFQKNKFRKLLSSVTSDQRKYHILKEVLTSIFFPKWIFALKYYWIQKSNILYNPLLTNELVTDEIYLNISQYIDKKIPLDKILVEKIFNILFNKVE